MKKALTTIAIAALLTACSAPAEDRAEPTASADVTPAPSATTATPLVAAGAVGLPLGFDGSAELPREGSECVATGTYSAIESRAQVQVLDSAGAIVGTGGLGPGSLVVKSDSGQAIGCQWEFKVPVEPGGSFYSVKVADWQTDAIAEDRLASTDIILAPTDIDGR